MTDEVEILLDLIKSMDRSLKELNDMLGEYMRREVARADNEREREDRDHARRKAQVEAARTHNARRQRNAGKGEYRRW